MTSPNSAFACSFLRLLTITLVALFAEVVAAGDVADTLRDAGVNRGVVAVLGLPEDGTGFVSELGDDRALIVYFQSADLDQVAAVRQAAEDAGLLGKRVFVDAGSPDAIPLADNLADAVLVSPSAVGGADETELLRVLHPRATAFVGDRKIVKPVPDGTDDWSHAYHGADNNPQSNDQHVRGDFQTQFIAEPKFSPMPEQTVAAGGRLFKAMGHIAHKANQNEMLNTLLGINAYNGTILWRRELSEGFMIHRNTMIATDDALYMGDHEACKVIDAATGEVRREITIPEDITDGQTWKWMAVDGDVLYALVGNPEVKVETMRSDRRGLGHWPWGMWKGHDYKDPRTAFGYGRTLVALNRQTGELLWHYRDDEFLDARAVCMKGGRIYCFCPENFLACVDAETGKLLWKNADKNLLDAIGSHEKAQFYITGYATTCYMKCDDNYVFFAGPQRSQMVVASALDGRLEWTYPVGNVQLVLREDAIYAAGPQNTEGVRLAYTGGSVLSNFPARRACTRATGCVDSIFYRATGGTVRVLTETNQATHIAPMRPPCQDGVIISNGHLYWGPWMCGCQLSLYGNIGLRPAGDATQESEPFRDALTAHADITDVQPLAANADDWTSFRGNNSRTDVSHVELPAGVTLRWRASVSAGDLPTAPVAAGGLVFVADRSGVVRALDADGRPVWKQYTSGPVYYPPAVAHDRIYVGSADGRVYAYEARTGRPLWTFRVAPQDRRILVFGKLVSNWPVAGGVVVEGDSVYAAAGITHYDGTALVKLNALTGELEASNTSSGRLSEQVHSGVSMQGELLVAGGELRFMGGGVYEMARYDLETLECLNAPTHEVFSQYRTAFYPWYPEYGKYVSLEYTCADGNVLCHDASYEGSLFGNLALQTPLPEGTPQLEKDAARNFLRRRGRDNTPTPKELWQDTNDRRFTGFIVSPDRLLAAGHPDAKPDDAFLALLNVGDGTDVWSQPLPADAVKGGLAIDAAQHIYVSLENGELLCFAPTDP